MGQDEALNVKGNVMGILVEPRSRKPLRNLPSRGTVVALLVAICTATLPANADETGADQTAQGAPAKAASGEALQEIVVTARYKSENEQKIPISMTTLNADEIAARGFTSTLDLTESTPNVTI